MRCWRVSGILRSRMLEKWKRAFRAFEKSPPGERFQKRYEARKTSGSPIARIAFVVVGLILVVGGAILLVIPGPGLLVIAFGGALMAQESLWIARGLDWVELRLRELYRRGLRLWKKASMPVRVAIVAVAAAAACGAGYLAYLWFFQK